jgi:hypothetical protein
VLKDDDMVGSHSLWLVTQAAIAGKLEHQPQVESNPVLKNDDKVGGRPNLIAPTLVVGDASRYRWQAKTPTTGANGQAL